MNANAQKPPTPSSRLEGGVGGDSPPIKHWGLRAWRLGGFLLAPVAAILALWRLARGQEERHRLRERFGYATLPRPEGKLIWLHGASIGEVTALLPLARRLMQEDSHLQILLTSTTRASSLIVTQRIKQYNLSRFRHQYAPYDYPAAVHRFLHHWRPHLAIWTESELWPHLILATRSRGVPMAQVSAWMSENSWRRWRRFPRATAEMLNLFSLCLPRDESAANRLRDLRHRPCDAVTNLKEAAADLPFDAAELAAMRTRLGSRPCWLATNTRAGEEIILAQAHARLRRRHPHLLLLLAPRRPERARALVRALQPCAQRIQLRSNTNLPLPETGIYIIDSFGELGLFYRAVPLVFLGGSLVAPGGGHNPLEPARLNCFLLHGPHVSAYSSLFAALDAAGGGQPTTDETALTNAVDTLLQQPQSLQQGAEAAHRFAAARGAGILDATAQKLLSLMKEKP